MGYEVHITRAADWTGSRSLPITLFEWYSYLDSDPEMRRIDAAEAKTTAGVMRFDSEGLSVWTGWSQHGVDGKQAWFDYDEGRISVNDPDPEIVCKLHAIARDLGARVLGDDGEAYDESGEVIAVAAPRPSAPPPPRKWWQRLFGPLG
jgi:hypothetical protein